MAFANRRGRPWQLSGLVGLALCGVLLAPQAAFAAKGGHRAVKGTGQPAGGSVLVTCAFPQTESPAATVSAAWTDSSIPDHVATTLRITVHKSFTCGSVSGAGLQVARPATLYVATGTPTSSCAGTLTANIGTSVISLSSTTLASAAGDCVVEVPVAGYSSGTHTLTAASFTN